MGTPKGKFLYDKKLRAQLMADREVVAEHWPGRPAAGSQVEFPIMVGWLGAPVLPHNSHPVLLKKAQQDLPLSCRKASYSSRCVSKKQSLLRAGTSKTRSRLGWECRG